MRTKVLFLDHTAVLSGGEIALLRLLQCLDRERYEPIVLLCSDGPLRAALINSGVETHLLRLTPRVLKTSKDSLAAGSLLQFGPAAQLLLYTFRVGWFIRRRCIDLVHTNSLKADLIGGIAGRLAGIPVIWHIHDRIEDDYLPGPAVAVFRRLARILPNQIVANSRATLQTLRLPDSSAATVVYNGVAIEPPHPLGTGNGGIVDRGGSSDPQMGAPLVGIVGRICPWKGQHIFIRAAALVRERFPRVRFQVIGAALFEESGYEAEVRTLASSLGLDDCLEFTGFRRDVDSLMSQLDLLVHASTVPEPFGQVIIEGMAAGKPVVATDGGGVREIVVDGETGRLVPMGDSLSLASAITELLANPEQARQMGRAGFERVRQRFTLEQNAQTVEAVYEQLLRRPKQQQPAGPLPEMRPRAERRSASAMRTQEQETPG